MYFCQTRRNRQSCISARVHSFAQIPHVRRRPSSITASCRPRYLSVVFPRLHLAALVAHATVGTLADVDARGSSRVVLGAVDQSRLDIGGQAVECLVDVDVALGRDLEEGDAELVGEGLALLCRDDALVLPVALVADQDLVDALGSVLLDVLEPRANVYPPC